jgi:hypothetical protein
MADLEATDVPWEPSFIPMIPREIRASVVIGSLAAACTRYKTV